MLAAKAAFSAPLASDPATAEETMAHPKKGMVKSCQRRMPRNKPLGIHGGA